MNLQINDLFEMQNILDNYIFKQHQLIREETIDRRILALLVEISELANETRCFKFWSCKGANEKSKILEEYVDGIHFFLSLGMDIDVMPTYLSSEEVDTELSLLFLKVYEKVCVLQHSFTEKNYKEAFQIYLQIADSLSFTPEEIRQAYFEKNKINHKRQLENY